MKRTPRKVKPPARPLVFANFAVTWDGRISTRSQTPADFSSKTDKARFLEIRSLADAVLVGRKTVEIDHMSIGLPSERLQNERIERGQTRFPIRVVVSNSGRINTGLPLFQKEGGPIHIFTTHRIPPANRRTLEGKATLHIAAGDSVSIPALLGTLQSELNIRSVVCEGGPTLFRDLAASRCLDEFYLTLVPCIFGGVQAPTLTGLPGVFLPESLSCKLETMSVVGGECFLKYKVLP